MEDNPGSTPYPGYKWRWIFGGIAISGYLALYLGWLLSGARSPAERLVAGNLAVLFPAGVALALAWRARQVTRFPEERRSWITLSVGLLVWIAASLINGLLSGTRFATLAFALGGCLRLSSILICLTGWSTFPRQLRQSFGRLRLLLEISLSSSAVVTLAWLWLIQPLMIVPGHPPAGYPWMVPFAAIDLLLLVMLMNSFALSRPIRNSATLAWIALGLTVFIVCDLVTIALVFLGMFQVGGPLDWGWAVGASALIAGLMALPETAYESEPVKPSVVGVFLLESHPLARSIEQTIQNSLPFVAVLALGGYVLLSWQVYGAADPLGMWMIVILFVGLVARQGVLAGEMELQQYAMLVNSIAEPAFICERSGQLKMVNPALLNSLGYTQPASLVGQPMRRLFTRPDWREEILKLGLTMGWSGEASFVRQDGSSFPVTVSLRPIRADHAGTGMRSGQLALAGTAHDLTEQKQQQNALKIAYDQVAAAHRMLETLNDLLENKVEEKTHSLSQALQQLEQQNLTLQKLDELKTDFVSLVSHELRAPLTNISGGIELVLARSRNLPEGARQSLDLVQVEIRRLAHFVETILDLSALDAGRLPFLVTPLGVSEAVRAVKPHIASMPGVERVHWEVRNGLPLMLADSRALTSIFFHLIDNAIKYAPQGDILVRIGLADDALVGDLSAVPQWPIASAEGLADGPTDQPSLPDRPARPGPAPFYPAEVGHQVIQVQVIDQGPGIPVEVMPLLFDKFFRVHRGDAQMVYGHGLGLYMVRRMLQAMSGDIRVENLTQGGACFTFWLLAIEEKDEHEAVVGG